MFKRDALGQVWNIPLETTHLPSTPAPKDPTPYFWSNLRLALSRAVLRTKPFAISLIIITLSFPALIRTCLLPLLHEVDPDVLLPVLEENSIINVIQTSMTSLVIQDLKATAIMKVAIDHILPLELDLDELVH